MPSHLTQVHHRPTIHEIASSETRTVELPPNLTTEVYDTLIGILDRSIADAVATDGLDLGSLKHVLVSGDFVNDVTRRLKELGRPELVTSNESAQALGKTITWGKPSDVSSIVIVPEPLLSAYEAVSLSRGILYHELAHVHDDRFRCDLMGETIHPDARDLKAVISFIAATLWSEYFCEQTAARHYSRDDLAAFAENDSIVSDSVGENSREIAEYRSHADILHLWQHSIFTVNIIMGVVGRTLGEFYAQNDNLDLRQQFIDGVSSLKGMPELISMTEPILDSMHLRRKIWVANELDCLNEVVLKAFNMLGIFPRMTGQGLYVDVP